MTQIAYEFLFTFHSNYGAILYHLGDIATYWQKIAKFLYLTASEVFQVQCSEFCPFRYTYGTCVSLSPAPDPVQYIISFLALVVPSGVIGSRNGEGNRLKGMVRAERCFVTLHFLQLFCKGRTDRSRYFHHLAECSLHFIGCWFVRMRSSDAW